MIEIKTPGRASCRRVPIRNLRKTTESFQAYNPRCHVIAGRVASLGDDDVQKKSFELFRRAVGVQVIAFDEVRARLKSIREVLSVDEADGDDVVSERQDTGDIDGSVRDEFTGEPMRLETKAMVGEKSASSRCLDGPPRSRMPVE